MLICPQCGNKITLFNKKKCYFICHKCQSVLAYELKSLLVVYSLGILLLSLLVLNIIFVEDLIVQIFFHFCLAVVSIFYFIGCLNYFRSVKLEVVKKKEETH